MPKQTFTFTAPVDLLIENINGQSVKPLRIKKGTTFTCDVTCESPVLSIILDGWAIKEIPDDD